MVGGSGEGEVSQATEDAVGAPVVACVASGKGRGRDRARGRMTGETTRRHSEERKRRRGEGGEQRRGKQMGNCHKLDK